MIGVVDYGAGNIRSISRGLVHAGAEVKVAQTGDELAGVDAIVLPGVGHAGQLMRSLVERGFDRAIKQGIDDGTPYLGICVGLQIMFDRQEEGAGHGLAVFPGDVQHLPRTLKTPHMGWSLVTATRDSPFASAGQQDYYYFVHSYSAVETGLESVVAVTEYGVTFPSVLIQDHVWGCQFHPEKSSTAGLAFLAKFVQFARDRVPMSEAMAAG
jgi:glutamine amidotransferase